MKNYISKAFAAMGLLALTATVVAKNCPYGKDPEACRAKAIDTHLEKLTEELSLNKKQEAQVREIIEQKWDKKAEIHREKHEQMAALSSETHDKIKTVLNKKQAAKLDEMRAEKPCCPKAGEKGHQCPNGKGKGCCPMSGKDATE